MHYKKTVTTGGDGFGGLQAQLGQNNPWNLPAIAQHSNVMFAQLDQISRGKLAGFSRSLAATFGTTPWKTRDAKQGDDLFGITAQGIAGEWLNVAEGYLKQMLKSQFGATESLRGSSGTASRGQLASDFATMLTRTMGRNL